MINDFSGLNEENFKSFSLTNIKYKCSWNITLKMYSESFQIYLIFLSTIVYITDETNLKNTLSI